MKKILFVILFIVALIIIVPLSYNNSDVVSINYLFGQTELPLSWLIFGAFVLGVLMSLPFFAVTGWTWKLKAKGLKKQIDELIKQRKRNEIAEQFNSEKNS